MAVKTGHTACSPGMLGGPPTGAAGVPMLASMALKLIVGPPNSGRTGATLARFRAAAARDPVLVVPTLDDVERFEEELTGDGDVVIGATVGTFGELFGLVARATDAPAGPAISRTQRLRLAREAEDPGGILAAARISGRPGRARLRAAGLVGRPRGAPGAGGGGRGV